MALVKVSYTKVLEQLRQGQIDQGKSMAAMSQQVADMNDWLFGVEGAIPRLGKSISDLAARVDRDVTEESQVCLVDRKELRKRVDAAEGKILWFSGAATGVGVVVGIILRWVAGKFRL